ncbi:TIGR01548 family HAD-type hydrolase [Spirulina subsalsa]|uniref:TIGR01548 family HAD-type hydrolase n=1 Tax=Spirulina subsalsa TaxID=54311 RepID=UPI0002DE3340|nr:TIGR01548 family HAD-type hydrolase [Spirulina subsalsa]
MIIVFDIDGVIRNVGGSYRRAIMDTVAHFTQNQYRPSLDDIDQLKGEGIWNNDWEASQELIYRYFIAQGQSREDIALNYEEIVEFFQRRYRGTDPNHWNGYITQEPLLVDKVYFDDLTAHDIPWGFFSGATRGSAEYVLKHRLRLVDPVLVAMEDAPGKPDPTGLFLARQQLTQRHGLENNVPVLYVGDTVGDLYTITQAKAEDPQTPWIGIGILPPHVQTNPEQEEAYSAKLRAAGAQAVFNNVGELTPEIIRQRVQNSSPTP